MFIQSRQAKSVEALSDQEAMERYRKTGDQKMIDLLFSRYAHLTLGVCLKILKNREESKDLVMIIFEKISTLLKHETIDNFNNWLFVFARNSCFNHLRKKKVLTAKQASFEENEKTSEIFMENEGFTRLYNREESEPEMDVASAIKKLGEEQRTCLQLFFYEKKRYKEIATELKLSEKQVKSHLQNGKRNLKQLLLEQYS